MQVLLRTVALIAITLLAATLTTGPSTAAETMTRREAKETYLKHICRQNDALERLDKAIWRGRDDVDTVDITPEWMRQINEALDNASRKYYRSSQGLLNPRSDWPADVVVEVERMGNQSLVVSNQFAKAIGGRVHFVRRWVRYVSPELQKSARLSREARAVLGLPPNGQGCD